MTTDSGAVATAEAQPQEQPQNLGSMIDELYELRERRKELTAQAKEIKAEEEELEKQIIAKLEEQGTTLARGSAASASIVPETIGEVDDWDAVYQYIFYNDAFYLLPRRLNNGAWKELQDAGEDVPGITPLLIKKISVRKVKK